jgi:hypothetical protein
VSDSAWIEERMKSSRLLILLLTLGTSVFAQFQTITSVGTTPVDITIPAGQVLQALTFVHETSVGYIRLSSGAPPFIVLQSSSPGSATPTSCDPAKLLWHAVLECVPGCLGLARCGARAGGVLPRLPTLSTELPGRALSKCGWTPKTKKTQSRQTVCSV